MGMRLKTITNEVKVLPFRNHAATKNDIKQRYIEAITHVTSGTVSKSSFQTDDSQLDKNQITSEAIRIPVTKSNLDVLGNIELRFQLQFKNLEEPEKMSDIEKFLLDSLNKQFSNYTQEIPALADSRQMKKLINDLKNLIGKKDG